MRGLKYVTVLTLTALMTVIGSGAALGNGNTTADEPAKPQTQASTKSVKKAPIKKAPAKKKAKKTKPAAPAPKRETSLDKGIALAQQERYQAALPWLQKAVQENPNSAAAWYWYGKCHEQTGQFYQAQYFYARAVKCDPTFDPLSRVVVYPNDPSGKIPVWDPKRPARVYPVPTQQKDGIVIVPPDAAGATKLPSRPARDPELPKVPSYVPPQPGRLGEKGPDEPWQPAIYVPPSRIDTIGEGEETAVYMPPEAPRVTQTAASPAQPVNVSNPAADLSGFQNLLPAVPGYQVPTLGDTRGNAPMYQPPQPPEPEKKPRPAKSSKKAPAKAPRKAVKKTPASSNSDKTADASAGNKRTPENQDLDEPRLPVIPEPETPILLPKKQTSAPVQSQQQTQPAQPKSQGQAEQSEQDEQKQHPIQIEREEFLPPVGQRYD